MKRFLTLTFALAVAVLAGCSAGKDTGMRSGSAPAIDPDTVKAGLYDTGKMWTFDFPPMQYFANTYNFNPSTEWFEKARLASLRLPNCTASFVSEDGLVMTNHHCARSSLDRVTRDEERLAVDGFYAPTLADERKVPNLYIDQLLVLEDVTREVQEAFDSGANDDDRIARRDAKMRDIQSRYAANMKETSSDSMVFSVVTFYNGGRYSLYGYRRYTDIRIVYAPEEAIAFFGGDPDNFTYPRYNLDVSFFRVYDNEGKPLKTRNFFKYSATGAREGEAVFVIGNPGSTNRLLTVAQLEFNRDIVYPYIINALQHMAGVFKKHVAQNPADELKYRTQIFGYENSIKAITGYRGGLIDPYLFARKVDFERTFKNSIMTQPSLKTKYSAVWKELASLEQERAKRYWPNQAFTFFGLGRSAVLSTANNLVEYAHQMKLPEDQRSPRYSGTALEKTKDSFVPAEVVPGIQLGTLEFQLGLMAEGLGASHSALKGLTGGKTPAEAAASLLKSTIVTDKEKVAALVDAGPDAILGSTDLAIAFVVKTREEGITARDQYSELLSRRAAKVQLLGRAMYEAYGTSIPPDATFTLRIADGVVKGYEYNGTVAPAVTTFYGLYDRYYSFGTKDPWGLDKKWINPPASFNMATPMNFVSTNDIIGGNSGSPVINVNLEVVGLIFDGNIESLPGNVIFAEDKNRSVSVHTAGILEAMEDIYKAERIVEELKASKIN